MRKNIRSLIGNDGELRLPFKDDPRKDKPTRKLIFYVLLLGLLLPLLVFPLYLWQSQLTDDNYVTFQDQLAVDAQGEWQDTDLIAEPGDTVIIKYKSGKWKSYEQEGWVDASGGFRCEEGRYSVACDEIVTGFPWSGMIARIGNGTPFAVGKLVRHYVITDERGVIRLRMNDRGVGDNQGEITMSVTIQRPIPTPTPTP